MATKGSNEHPVMEVRTEAQVALRNVTRYFDAVDGRRLHALGPLSLELRKGEFFSVVGPSGCGKSTLLEVVAGLSRATEGAVLFEGKPVAGEVPEGIGVVFQEDASFPWLSVRDNIAFGLRQRGAASSSPAACASASASPAPSFSSRGSSSSTSRSARSISRPGC